MALRKKFKDICVVNDACEIEYIRMSVPDFFGFKPEEAIGKTFPQIYRNLDENTSTFVRAIQRGERYVDYVQILENTEGRVVTQLEDIYLLKDGSRIVGAVEFAEYDVKKDVITPKRTDLPTDVLSDEQATEEDIIGSCETIMELKKKISKVRDIDSPVMIMGETGTGKELTARVIHNSSSRRNNPYVYINCSALPENLLEGILFGIKKGSFTDAEEKSGLFQMADKGTLFLDEVDSMPLGIQSKILRAIEEKCIRPIGGTEEIYLDVRIIASCNKQTNELLASESLRNDLLFRLSVIQFALPPLKKRGNDILLIADYYRKKYNEFFQKEITGFSPEAKEYLLHHDWPGNVRELKNMMEGLYPVMQESTVGIEHIMQRWQGFGAQKPTELQAKNKSTVMVDTERTEIVLAEFTESGQDLKTYMETYERERVEKAWRENECNYRKTADALGISIQLLKYKMKKFSLE